MMSHVVECSENKIDKDASHRDKDKIVKSLSQEVICNNFAIFFYFSYILLYLLTNTLMLQIQLLKAKIKEYGYRSDNKGTTSGGFKLITYNDGLFLI